MDIEGRHTDLEYGHHYEDRPVTGIPCWQRAQHRYTATFQHHQESQNTTWNTQATELPDAHTQKELSGPGSVLNLGLAVV